jgi:hypothetical protein
MPKTTWDYAKLGQRTYQVVGHVWRDDEPVEVGSGEYDKVQAAKFVALNWTRKGATGFTIWRGTYVDDGFHDLDDGYVRDATWQQDDNWIINGQANNEGGIDWEEETW